MIRFLFVTSDAITGAFISHYFLEVELGQAIIDSVGIICGYLIGRLVG